MPERRTVSASLLAVAVGLLFALPFLWALSLSLRPPLQTFAVDGWGLPWIDFAPRFDAWLRELGDARTQGALLRSTWVSGAATALALLLGLPAAWALGRARRRGLAGAAILGCLALRLFPPIAVMVPFWLFFLALGLLDTGAALVVVNATFLLPLAIIIMRQAFVELPPELEEAAAIDGAGPVAAFLRIVLPLVAPSIAGTALVLFAFAWNDYLFASALFLMEADTVTLRIQQLGGPGPGGAARMLLAIALPLAVALIAQRWLIRGLTLGAVKG